MRRIPRFRTPIAISRTRSPLLLLGQTLSSSINSKSAATSPARRSAQTSASLMQKPAIGIPSCTRGRDSPPALLLRSRHDHHFNPELRKNRLTRRNHPSRRRPPNPLLSRAPIMLPRDPSKNRHSHMHHRQQQHAPLNNRGVSLPPNQSSSSRPSQNIKRRLRMG